MITISQTHLKMENIKKWLSKKEFKFEVLKMQDGNSNIFIDVNNIKEVNDIRKYINKYTDFKIEFRCNYTVLRVY